MSVGKIIEEFAEKMKALDVKVMEIHVHNLDRLKLHLLTEDKTRVSDKTRDLFYGVSDYDTIRFVNKDWWIEYCWSAGLTRKEYFNWRPAFRNLLKFDNPVAVEVGILEGFNAKLVLQFVDMGKFYLVDPYQVYKNDDLGNLDKITQPEWDNIYEKVKERFKDDKCVELIRKTSEEASKDFPNESLDFVYLDGDHTKEGVKKDLECWFPKVKKGGYIAGHDADDTRVKSAVYDFYLSIYGSDVTKNFVDETVESDFNDWWIKKI